MATGPLLVFGPRSTAYDFGPGHPLTPRRFGPGIDLLARLGAEPAIAPEPATDDDLLLVHTARYIAAVRRLSADPEGPPEAGIGPGDDPAFAGMHDAAAAVAGGSMRAMEALLAGAAEHAYHPGGGLHHAMPDRASGFCIYDDPALAIAIARRAGLRVLYIDLDVHHGDGVQAIHADDPGVVTISIHEDGRYLFPGTGAVSELGRGRAAGTVLNLPLEPMTGEDAWLGAVASVVPLVAAAFGPDVVVSQHGADSHAWDPLAHLRVTTTAMGRAARLVDRVAHRWGRGAWLATGGGGYDAYRVVPRAWALTWLAGAHAEPPDETPVDWRERWSAEAERRGQAPLPARFDDPSNGGLPLDDGQRRADRAAAATASLVASIAVPALLREAAARGWWDAAGPAGPGPSGPLDRRPAREAPVAPPGTATILGRLDPEAVDRLRLAARVVAPFDAEEGRRLLSAAIEGGAEVTAAAVGDVVVGVAIVAPPDDPRASGPPTARLLGVGVAPGHRGAGLGGALLRDALAALPAGVAAVATATVAERDPVEPLDADERRAVAERVLSGAGFRVGRPAGPLAVDPWTVEGLRPPG